MESLKAINKRLQERYGVAYDGRPNFRVVFSDTQFETRYGTFEVYCGPIFLREETCYKEVPKYDYIVGKHILEELKFGNFPDKPFVQSSYEPLWTFMDKERKPLYPVWDAVEIVVLSRLEGTRKALIGPRRDWKKEEQEAFEKEVIDFDTALRESDGVHEFRNQHVNFVKPVFLNTNGVK